MAKKDQKELLRIHAGESHSHIPRMSYQDPEYYSEYPYLALRDLGVMLWPDLDDLVDEWLKVLREEGLPDRLQLRASRPSRHSSSGISFKTVTVEDPMNDPSDRNTYAARLDNGEVIWVRIDESLPQGYEVRVLKEAAYRQSYPGRLDRVGERPYRRRAVAQGASFGERLQCADPFEHVRRVGVATTARARNREWV